MKKIRNKNKGITLVALIITIIILLILSGITIATLGGENGLFKKVKLGKERYAISEAKEKLELEITNLQIEQNGKGEQLTKEDLPKMNNEEIDVRDTTNFPVEVIYKNYEFEVDSNFKVTYVGEANETIITYTTEPEGYTNQNNIKILVKITNPKGIKSILKPGETDKILPQDKTTAGIEFTVTKNGHYILTVEDVDENEVSKDIYIDLIDTLVPEEFTPEVQKNGSTITIVENGKDAEATEESSKSGIDHYEYYVIDSSNKETKYDNNKIENLALGTYKVYVIAFDKAGNSRKSNEVEFKISRQYKEVSVGDNHSLGIDSEGKLWAWGNNSDGQLGDGTTTNRTTPVEVKSDKKFKHISAGYHNSFAIDTEGYLWAWGTSGGEHWALGDGSTTTYKKPKQIKSDTKFVQVSAGLYYCLAIDSEGNLWGWGKNDYAQIGDGTRTSVKAPKKIFEGTQFKEISAGEYHSFAIDVNDDLWLWGFNGNSLDSDKIYITVPTKVEENKKFKKISSVYDHNLAIDIEGNLWSWGKNDCGQLGDGTTENRTELKQIKPGIKFNDILAAHISSYAIDIYGKIWAWGYNSGGRLGIGTYTKMETEPIQIDIKTKMKLINSFDCTLGLDIDGNLWAWGNNYYGQYGNGVNKYGNPVSSSIPTQI